MAPRPNWKGYLKLSLVSCPIALYPAVSSGERVSFRQINKNTGNRLRQQLVDEVTRDVVESADKGRGYEVGKGVYIPVEDDELEAIQVESTHTVDIEKFVPRDKIDVRYFDSPYYVVPTDQVGAEAFAVIREAMTRKGMAGLGSIVMAKRQRPIIVEPFGKGMRALTLRYPYEVRNEADYFSDIADVKISADMIQLAEHLITTKAGEFDPTQFVDEYEKAVVELLKKKQAGMPVPSEQPSAPTRQNVVNLMEVLRRSVAESKGGKSERKPPAASKKAQAKSSRSRKAG
jgi:DNA end-binding protein Ku